MRVSSSLIACVAGLCIAGNSALAEPPPPAYVVNLSPPVKVGDKYHYTCKATETKNETIARAHGKTPTKTDITVELDGIITVKKIDAHGAATWLDLKVTYLRANEGGIKGDIVPAGSILSTQTTHVVADKYSRFIKWEGGHLGPDRVKLVEKVFMASMPDAPTTQDIFGSASPQMPGGGWAINRQRGVQYLSSLNFAVEPKDFTGKVQFVGIEKLGDTDAFHVDASMKASAFKSTVTSNVTTEKASLWLKFSTVVPRDLSLRSVYSSTGHVEITEKGVDDQVQGFRREMSRDFTEEATVEPVK